jgi:hypothetical protein
MVQKWSILWRSIIASSLGATLFPYCRYIKILDLRDLKYLLEDDRFNRKVAKYATVPSCALSPERKLITSRHFFSGPMAHFQNMYKLTANGGRSLDHVAIVNAVGEGKS